MKTKILFRLSYDLESVMQKNDPIIHELNIAKKYFDVVHDSARLHNCNVIGRYSVLPYYKELVSNLKIQGSELVNSHKQHCYIANFEYYHDIEEFTPKTWFRLEDIQNQTGPFILKGVTNSRKHEWDKFYAPDFKKAVEIYCDLKNDSLIGQQDIIIRKFEKLKDFGQSISGIPFANEWRFFFYKGNLLSYGFYWTGAANKPKKENIDPKAIDLAKKVSDIVKDNVNFYVIDVAQKENGEWIVVELNDGMMSGLSDNDPEELYKNLFKYCDTEIE
jgi:hypothetical protein